MLPPHLHQLVRGVEAGEDVSGAIRHALCVENAEVTRAQRLQLATAIARAAEHTPASAPAFYLAVEALRALAPFLRRSDADPVVAAATVEKYAVNYALLSCEAAAAHVKLECSGFEVAGETLSRVFEARGCAKGLKNRPSPRVRSTRRATRAAASKENCDPQCAGTALEEECGIGLGDLLDVVVFKGASAFGLQGLLPAANDVETVAAVVAGALTARVVYPESGLELVQRLTLARDIAVPWITHLRKCPASASSGSRHADAYSAKIRKAILLAVQGKSVDPVEGLRCRAFVATLGNVSLEDFARSLLRDTRAYLRSASQKATLERASLYEHIAVIYEDSFKFTAQFGPLHIDWYKEDVAAWIDHVFVVWARRVKEQPIPQFIKRRASADIGNEMLTDESANETAKGWQDSVHQFQLQLASCGAFADSLPVKKAKDKSPHDDGGAWDNIQKVLQSAAPLSCILGGGADHEDSNLSPRLALRYLRVLEPIRKTICIMSESEPSLPLGAETLLQLYVISLAGGLTRSNEEASSIPPNNLKYDAKARLHKMLGAALEAASALLHSLATSRDLQSMCSVVEDIDFLLRQQPKHLAAATRTWCNWISRATLKCSQRTYTQCASSSTPEAKDKLNALATVLERSASWPGLVLSTSSSCENAMMATLECVKRLSLAVHCCLSSGDLCNALRIAAIAGRHLAKRNAYQRYPVAKNTVVEDLFYVLGRAASQKAFADADALDLLLDMDADSEPTEDEEREWMEILLHALQQFAIHVRRKQHQSGSLKTMSDALRGNLIAQRKVFSTCVENDRSSCLQLCPRMAYLNAWTSATASETFSHTSPDPDRLSQVQILSEEMNYNLVQCGATDSEEGHGGHCSQNELSFFRNLTAGWLSVEIRDTKCASRAIAELDKLVVGLTSSEDVLLLYLLELMEWAAVVFTHNDIDESSLAAAKLSEVCEQKLGIGSCPEAIAELYRRLGMRAECMATVNGSEKPELLGTRARLLNDLGCYDEAELIVDGQTDADCLGALADALQHGDANNLMEALRVASMVLKDLLRKLHCVGEVQECGQVDTVTITGVQIRTFADIRFPDGRLRLANLVALVTALERVSILHLRFESLFDARYYSERAVQIARRLFAPDSCVLRRQEARFAQISLSLKVDRFDVLEECEWLNCEPDSELPDGVNPLSLARLLCARGDAAFEAHSGAENPETMHAFCLLAMRCFDLALILVDAAIPESAGHKSLPASKLDVFATEITVKRGCARLACGDAKASAVDFKKLLQLSGSSRQDVKVAALFGYLQSLVRENGGMEELMAEAWGEAVQPSTVESTVGRITRSKAKRRNSQESKAKPRTLLNSKRKIHSLLDAAENLVASGHGAPHLSRQIWRLRGALLGTGSAAAFCFSSGYGTSFALRWTSAHEARNLRLHRKPGDGLPRHKIDALERSIIDLTISDKVEDSNKDFLLQLMRSECFVVGLGLDESKTSIFVWRMSASGTRTERRHIPTEGPNSYAGVLERIDNILSSMKESAVLPGRSLSDIEKSTWWQQRFELDAELGEILMDIEQFWLDDLRDLLTPDNSVAEANAPARPSNKLVLVLDTSLEQFPWESIPVLRKASTGTTRVPSLMYLENQLSNRPLSLDAQSVYYLVNPGGDLRQTEKKFGTLFMEQPGWKGSSGLVHDSKDVLPGFRDAEILLYCGHGGGEKYISPRSFGKSTRAPVAILMGCSSARLEQFHGNRESSGTAIEYLVHGAPAVVGNLWDVSDRDIDRLTTTFLSSWLGVSSDEPAGEALDLADSLAQARSACKFPFLVGAATVVYGAPGIWART